MAKPKTTEVDETKLCPDCLGHGKVPGSRYTQVLDCSTCDTTGRVPIDYAPTIVVVVEEPETAAVHDPVDQGA